MSYAERLNMLFDGEDAGLLGIDVGLREVRIDTQDQSGQNQDQAPDLPLLDVVEVEVANPGDKQAEASSDDATEIQAAEPEMGTAASKEDIPATEARPRAGETTYFCPIEILSTPYKYIGGKFLQPIVDRFYKNEKFWERRWDLYSVRVPKHILCMPFLFTPASQAQALIDEINAEFGCDISLPLEEEAGLIVPFTPDGTPQPKYIGTSTTHEMKRQLQKDATIWCSENPIELPKEEDDETFAQFCKRMKIVYDVKYKKHKGTNIGDGKQVYKIRRWHRQLKRTQCYLGLRPRIARCASRKTQIVDDATSTPAKPALEQQQQQQQEQQEQTNEAATVAIGTVLDPLDVESPAPFAFADEPIFICIDLEANERNHAQITEVGVSTLDTLDLVGVPPGEGGRNWMSKIRSRHFRVAEYKHFRNKKFVQGCPDDFAFGSSEFVRRVCLPQVVDACFKPPYSGHIDYNQQPVSIVVVPHRPSAVYLYQLQKDGSQERRRQSRSRHSRGRNRNQSQSPEGGVKLPSEPSNSPGKRGRSRRRKQWSPSPGTEPSSSRSPGQQHQRHPARTPSPTIPEYKMRPRKLILVGHALNGDIKNLSNIGCDFFDIETYRERSGDEFSTLSKFHDAADTANLHRILKRDYDPPGLKDILKDLDIMPWHLHNAGNDARYTLEAAVGIAVQITKAEARAESERDAIRFREYPDSENPSVVISPRSSDEDLHRRREVERLAKKPRRKRRKEDSEIEIECDIWEDGMGWGAPRNRQKDDMDGGLPSDVEYPIN
ncbi:hypothetical protein A7D00_0730 [Trichophyton violaceum]|uniref:Gfd2/YDR514C-like C-terminal domain-containing protein n=1 Tax=Trichophyton violaceum TaxID=34388 RepID=A0A178FRP9_TRIVO|nr:hypothetical protein A7D00_0730 [Trichophyton violaceum]